GGRQRPGAGGRGEGWAEAGESAVRAGHGQGPQPQPAGPAAVRAGEVGGRQGVQLPADPALAEAPRDQGRHPPSEGPETRRRASSVRPGGVPPSGGGRAVRRVAEGVPGRGHPLRQARHQLQGDCTTGDDPTLPPQTDCGYRFTRQSLARPTKKTLRLEKARRGPKMFEAAEVRALVDGAEVKRAGEKVLVRPTPTLRAMILLGVNCGFGNADCGTLPLSALDLDGGWVNYHRPKTGITRRCPLWPETVASLREVLAARPGPKDPADAGLVFLTVRGGSWHKKIEDNTISKEMRKLLDALGINGLRGYYALRHTFETVGGEAKDQLAVDHIMGHSRNDMASVYRARISDERLKAVTDHVRA